MYSGIEPIFEPTPTTKLERFKLMFKKMRYRMVVNPKHRNMEITTAIYYKYLNGKKFLIDKSVTYRVKIGKFNFEL